MDGSSVMMGITPTVVAVPVNDMFISSVSMAWSVSETGAIEMMKKLYRLMLFEVEVNRVVCCVDYNYLIKY